MRAPGGAASGFSDFSAERWSAAARGPSSATGMAARGILPNGRRSIGRRRPGGCPLPALQGAASAFWNFSLLALLAERDGPTPPPYPARKAATAIPKGANHANRGCEPTQPWFAAKQLISRQNGANCEPYFWSSASDVARFRPPHITGPGRTLQLASHCLDKAALQLGSRCAIVKLCQPPFPPAAISWRSASSPTRSNRAQTLRAGEPPQR